MGYNGAVCAPEKFNYFLGGIMWKDYQDVLGDVTECVLFEDGVYTPPQRGSTETTVREAYK